MTGVQTCALPIFNAFDQIINDMPRSQAALDLAKQGLDSRLRTERIIKDNIAWAYINAAELGHDSDPRKTLFEKVPSLTFDELGKFQRDNIAGRHYNFAILADLDDIDIEALRAMGRVVILTTEDIPPSREWPSGTWPEPVSGPPRPPKILPAGQ